MQSDRERLFLERATAERRSFPGEYDAGARLQGGWRFVRYALAVQNGEPIGEKRLPAARSEPPEGLSSGRVGIDTPIAPVSGWRRIFGPVRHGVPPRDARDEGDGAVDRPRRQRRRSIRARSRSCRARAADALAELLALRLRRRLRLGVERAGLGATVLYGELYWAKNLDRAVLPADPRRSAFGRDYREFGRYVALTQESGRTRRSARATTSTTRTPTRANTVMGATKPTALAYQTLSLRGRAAGAVGRGSSPSTTSTATTTAATRAGNPTNLADNAFTIRGEVSF